MSKVCNQCNGKGSNQGTEDVLDAFGNLIIGDMPNLGPILCSACNGTGQLNCFGAS
jgi:hypothetical protein